MPAENRRVTQADVARLAGVSQTTVSMVLNGVGTEQRRVGEQARLRVLSAIEETGYAANPSAQRLAGGRTSIIGVYTYESVFPHAASNFYHPFLEGAEHEAEQSEVDLLMFTSMSASFGRRLLSSGIGRLRVADGCVLLGRHSYPEDLAELLRQRYPFAFIGRRDSPNGPVPYAGAAYDPATEAVVHRLLELGHRRIVMVSEHVGHESWEDRARGYRTAMAAAGLAEQVVIQPGLSSREVIDTLHASGVTAIIATSDIAAPLRQAALARGLSIPEDLSIARLGDPERAGAEDVDWSGYLIPRHEMGVEAVRIVLRQLSTATTDPQLQVDLPCREVTGATIAPPPDPSRRGNA